MKNMNFADIKHYLKGLQFPIWKDDLIELMERREAPSYLIAMLATMRDREFWNETEILREMNQMSAIGGYDMNL